MRHSFFMYCLILFSLSFWYELSYGQVSREPEQVPATKGFREVTAKEVENAFTQLAPHPRLLLTAEQMNQVRKKTESDPLWAEYYQSLVRRGNENAKQPPLTYQKEGIRLLSISRAALGRLFIWGFLRQYTGEKTYSQRAEEEMLALAAFENWNPSHYLDTAEMTMAMAIGYDSFYDDLSDSARKTIRSAIRDHGIRTSYMGKPYSWLKNGANWNQVCHAGMLYGVLAIAEDEPKLARAITQRSVNGVTWSMASYEPDGNYPEGPGYWSYGTSFNILLIAGLHSALGTDFGRSDTPGFLKSIQYYEHVFGPTGNAYNYPDSGGGRMFEPSAFWYAQKLKQPGLTWNENLLLTNSFLAQSDKKGNSMYQYTRNRLAPCALLWGPSLISADGKRIEYKPPTEKIFVGKGNGLCPVVLLRTDWNPNAAWLGIKAGTPSSPHGHMDIGSFVYENQGVRWAVELGPENYNKIESRGMNLWGNAQNSDRWKLFRYNNYSHNTLTVNSTLQKAKGLAEFTRIDKGEQGRDSSVSIDLTPIYDEQLTSANRQATLAADGTLTLTDTVHAKPDQEATVQWRLATPTEVDIQDNQHVILRVSNPRTKAKKEMTLEVQASVPTEITTQPAETDTEYDAKNPGISLVIVQWKVPAGQTVPVTITFKALSAKK